MYHVPMLFVLMCNDAMMVFEWRNGIDGKVEDARGPVCKSDLRLRLDCILEQLSRQGDPNQKRMDFVPNQIPSGAY